MTVDPTLHGLRRFNVGCQQTTAHIIINNSIPAKLVRNAKSNEDESYPINRAPEFIETKIQQTAMHRKVLLDVPILTNMPASMKVEEAEKLGVTILRSTDNTVNIGLADLGIEEMALMPISAG